MTVLSKINIINYYFSETSRHMRRKKNLFSIYKQINHEYGYVKYKSKNNKIDNNEVSHYFLYVRGA